MHFSINRPFRHPQLEADSNNLINLELNLSCIYNHLAHLTKPEVYGFKRFLLNYSQEELNRAEKMIQYLRRRGCSVELAKLPTPSEQTLSSCLKTLTAAFVLEKMIDKSLIQLRSNAGKSREKDFVEYLQREYANERVKSIDRLYDYYCALKPGVKVNLKFPQLFYAQFGHKHHQMSEFHGALVQYTLNQNGLWEKFKFCL